MNPLIVIQARLGSTRLPGKVLLPLAGKPVLQHVVERCGRTGWLVVVACPYEDLFTIQDALGEMESRCVVTSPLDCDTANVLERYERVLHFKSVPTTTNTHVIRITADCPLVDPALIASVVVALQDGADYAGNTVDRHWPRGLDVEGFSVELLREALATATDPYDREHVTPWMKRWARHPIALPAPVPKMEPRWRWCLDTPRDYDWLTDLFTAYPHPTTAQAQSWSLAHRPPMDP